MEIDRLDHLVLTVNDIDRSILFYTTALGMKSETFGAERKALVFGRQKINLHPVKSPILPHAEVPTPGSADLCFITTTSIQNVISHLAKLNILIEEGPVSRTGATGSITSIYIRDPDFNLIEISNYNNPVNSNP